MVDTKEAPAQKGKGTAKASRSVAQLLAKLAGPEPKNIGELVDGMRTDYQVRLSELTIDALIQTVPVTIAVEEDGEFADELDHERAEELAKKLTTLWDSRLKDMLECKAYGRVAFEKVYDYCRVSGLQYVCDLEPLPFKQTTMLLDDEGRFNGINLKISEEAQLDLDPVKSWWLAIDTTATQPHGKSRFLGAPQQVWQGRRKLFKLRELFLNRCILKGGVAHIPMESSVAEDGTVTDESTNVEQAFDNYVTGGLIMLPNDRDVDTKQYKYDVTLPEGLNDPGPIESSIDGLDVEQVRAFGIPEKTIMEGQAVGSYAMVSLQMLVLYAVCDDLLGQAATSFQKYVIDNAVKLNWDEGQRPVIKITCPKLARQPDGLVVEIAKSMLTTPNLSPLILSGAIDILAMLEGLDVPISPEAEQIIRDMVARAIAQGQAGTPGAVPGEPVVNPAPALMSNDPAPVESASLSRVPSLDQLADEAAAESARIWEQIAWELSRMHSTGGHVSTTNVNRLLDELRQLRADAITAAKLLGMVSIWKPSINSVPDGFGKLQKTAGLSLVTVRRAQSETCSRDWLDIDPLTGISIHRTGPVTLALPGVAGGGPLGSGPPPGEKIRFSFVDEAVQWVLEKKLATASDVSSMAAADKLKVFTAAGIDDIPTLDMLRRQVSDSLVAGESLATFRKKLSDDLELSRSNTETLYRTNTKQAYDQGLTKTLEKPHVRERFGYVLFAATRDNRTRSSHWELDGHVAEVGSDLYKLFLAARADWNCRCGMIPITYEQAIARGISNLSDMPSEVTAKYARAI